jgi:osmoprotectant transport system substrate-binding protein
MTLSKTQPTPRRDAQPVCEAPDHYDGDGCIVTSRLHLHPTPARILALGATVLAALLISGCGSSGGGGKPGASASNSSAATGVTTGTATSALPGIGKPPVTIGDKNFTEEFVLGDLYREALQAQGFSVDLNQNIGPTAVTLQALASGSLDMYPEYLNTFDSAVAHYRRTFRSRTAAYSAGQRFALTHSMQLLAATPFSDTAAIGVTVGYANANRLHSVRDLTRVAPSLTLGGPPQFEQTHPGLIDLERTYGFAPSSYKQLAVGNQYTSLNDGSVQAADINTTDGELASDNYQVLADPVHVLGWGNVVPVVTTRTLSQEGPAFAATVNRISALLTTPVIRELNLAVDVAGQDPATVAKEFLETHDMIPPSS